MGLATAAAIGIGAGLVATGVGGAVAANAQGKAANAQLDEARRQREAVMAASAPSPAEIAAMDRAVALGEAAVARQERVLDAVDPTLIEAGQQALELLRGKDAEILAPLRKQRADQREALRQRLADQLGGGFETSSAGIKALNEFDNQTAGFLGQAQLNAVSGLLGTTLGARQQVNPLASVNTFASLADMLGGPNRRAVAGLTGTPITPYAGAPFVGAAAGGQALTGFGTGLVGLGGMMAGYGSKQQQPTPTPFGTLGESDLSGPSYGMPGSKPA